MSNGPTLPPGTQSQLQPLPSPVRGTDLLLVLILTLGSVRLLAGLLVAMAPPQIMNGGAGAGSSLTLVLAVLLFQTVVILATIRVLVIRKYGLSWADLGLRPAARRWYGRGIALAVLLLMVVAVINGVLIPQVSKEPFHNPQLYAVAPAGFSWPAFVSMLVMAGFVAPFGEELAFRGLLFPWLRERFGIAVATLLSGLCFAALHGVLILIPALTALGIAFALLYQRCGSLWPVIVAHGAFNAIMVIGLYAALAAGLELP